MIDILGTLYAPTVEGVEAIALPGYHVNTPSPVPEWVAFQVTPAAPRRVFGGHATFFYSFADEAEFLLQRTAANLEPQE
jgi:hypothetical protein